MVSLESASQKEEANICNGITSELSKWIW